MPSDSVLVQRISLPPPPRGSRFLELVFNVGRGELLPGPEQSFPAGYRFAVSSVAKTPPNVLRVELSDAAERVQLKLRSRGEHLELVKLRYGIAEESPPTPIEPPNEPPVVALTAPGTCADDAEYLLTPVPITVTVGGVSTSVGPPEYQAALDAELGSAPNTPATRYRRYFAELNRQTQPLLVDALNLGLSAAQTTGRKLNVDRAKSLLTSRVQERAKSLAVTTPPANSLIVPVIQDLSTLQLQIIDDHFLRGGILHLDEFNDAFEMFANGELRLQLPTWNWTTQPSSGYYFFFAEFALLAIDMTIDAVRWAQLAPPLVRTQHIFARVYKPADPNPGLASYGPCDYDPLRIYSTTEKASLVTTHPYATPLALEQGASANAKDYLPGA
jgi:hypothetical protein